ILILSIFNY
ncbi:putative membrane protein, partial [Chlamydia psittaci C6/98]